LGRSCLDEPEITKQSMSYLVDYLEQRGYLERRPDPSDRRAALISLTDRGWEQVRASLRIIATIEEEWASGLGQPRMQQLRELLGDLRQLTGNG
jgi:DNA-binding MarR family transcriptional regulator